MSTLSPKSGDPGSLDDATVTEGSQKINFESNRDVLEESLGGAPQEAITIASGSITPVVGSMNIDTESAAATG